MKLEYAKTVNLVQNQLLIKFNAKLIHALKNKSLIYLDFVKTVQITKGVKKRVLNVDQIFVNQGKNCLFLDNVNFVNHMKQ